MKEDEVKREALNTFMEEESDYAGEVEVIHLLTFLRDEIGWDKIKASIKNPLKDLRVAPYYGCTLTRPDEVTIDGGITPVIFQEFIETLGAESVDFDQATDCCSSYQMISNPEAALMTAGKVIASAGKQGADALIMSCPLCEYNLGKRQVDVIQKHAEVKPLPTFYFTQLLAVALGLPEEAWGYEGHYVDPGELLGLASGSGAEP